VFIPKGRKKALYGKMRKFLGPVLRELAGQRGSTIVEGHMVQDHVGRIYQFGDRVKPNKVSKRPLTQASRRCQRWLHPSSLQRIPTPLKRCGMSHVQALSTMPLPNGNPSSF
jgi:REP element-mobilizing transposase RayT